MYNMIHCDPFENVSKILIKYWVKKHIHYITVTVHHGQRNTKNAPKNK